MGDIPREHPSVVVVVVVAKFEIVQAIPSWLIHPVIFQCQREYQYAIQYEAGGQYEIEPH